MRQTPEGWRERLGGSVGSLGLHLAVLLAILFGWQRLAPVEHPPIPVRIVFTPPPKPKPPPRPKPPERRSAPRGPIASESFGDTNPRDLGPVNRTGLETGRALLPLDAPKPALIPLTSPLPQLDSMPRPLQKPRPPASRPLRRLLRAHRMTMQLAKYPGMAATKSEYMRYIRALVLQHSGLLLSSIGQREGEMVVTVLVRDNGTIAAMQVSKSSGYRDIDERFERMIAAVGRFPPLPQWFQGPAMAIDFILPFPAGLHE